MSVIGLEMPHTVVTVTDWQTGRLSCLIALKELVVIATPERVTGTERGGEGCMQGCVHTASQQQDVASCMENLTEYN